MALTKCRECGEQVSTKAASCPKCGAVQKKKTSVLTWIVVVILGIGVIGAMSGKHDGGNSTATASQSPRELAMKSTSLDFTWQKGGFDSVMEADFTITNKSAYTIKDITIECTHKANSGTTIDSNKKTIYDVVPANSARTFPKFNMGFINSQVASSSCEITDLKV